jgi:hypothetical protein
MCAIVDRVVIVVPSRWRYLDGAEPLGPTASKLEPSDYIPPPLLKWGGVYTLKWGGVYLYSPLVICAGGEYDGVDAASRAGGGAIDPVAERSGGLARVDGIGCSAIGQYSPPIFLIGGGQYDGFGATG